MNQLNISKLLALLPIFGVGLIVGCGPDLSHLPRTVKAEGIVTLDGVPVEGALLTFIADQGEHHASATSDKNGRFVLNAFPQKSGAVPGSYKVGVSKTVINGGKEDESGGETTINLSYGLPSKYASFTTSGLTSTIPDSGTSELKIDLTSK
jgi:hypothetical protein